MGAENRTLEEFIFQSRRCPYALGGDKTQMARRKQVLRCSCRNCSNGLHRKNRSKRNEVYYANHTLRRIVASLLRKAAYFNDDSSADKAQDIYLSAGYTD
jgi:hypothetical protein